MRVKGVSWVGVKTDQYVAMTTFFRDVIGLEAVAERDDFLVFRTTRVSRACWWTTSTVRSPSCETPASS
jgi:hypothetical protein